MKSSQAYGALAEAYRNMAAVMNGASPVVFSVAMEHAEVCHRAIEAEGFRVTRIPAYRDPGSAVLRIAAMQ